MSEKLITVVVPVYKVEPYIDKCLSSLIVPEEQLPLLEVIVVNDGTPDRSADMAREYEKRYPDVFRVIDKENGGHGSAWNRGVKEATGKYLRFLDSDDWFTTSEFSRLIERLKTLDVDVVISHYNRYYTETGETIKHPMYLEDGVDQTFSIGSFNWGKLSWEGFNFWGCTYRTEMIRNEHPMFMEGVYYDDAILFVAPVLLGKTFHVFDATIYNYLLGRPEQTVAVKIKEKNLASWEKTHYQVFDFCVDHLPELNDSGAVLYLASFLRDWLHDSLVKFSNYPFGKSKALTKEWRPYFKKIRDILPASQITTHTIKAFNNLPFPIYWGYRKLISIVAPPREG